MEISDQIIPRMRKTGLIVRAAGDDVLVYDLDSHKAHCLNRTASALWSHCDGEAKIGAVAHLLTNEFGAEVPEPVVWLGLDLLRKARLLEGSLGISLPMSRRQLMRRVAFATVVGLPLVTTIVAPRAAHAANCTPIGQPCKGNGNCCSKNCVGDVCV